MPAPLGQLALPAALASRIAAAHERAALELMAAREPAGHWTGWLSSSPLSTATAVTALLIATRDTNLERFRSQISAGLQWLADHNNPDGGWGDTPLSLTNLSTTTLGWACFGAGAAAGIAHPKTVAQAEAWLERHVGGLEPDRLAPAVVARYGKDRTFSVPILTLCALAGRLGTGRDAWRHVIPLPFELAACPPGWFAALRLPVVSYALPALIAIGQAHHHHAPSRNPVARLIRNLTRERTLRVLSRIQPTNGGFLEATPLTSFVTMSLAGSGHAEHMVTRKGLDFLLASQRPDGSWPIDTNLATWVTTLSVKALGGRSFAAPEATAVRSWLLGQQYRATHPYTQAAPGGWAWTDLPGGVPDADDTAGALLALRELQPDSGPVDAPLSEAVRSALRWLLNLQNRDGGIPTFCRGWGTLPFDRSSADITAHTVLAWSAWMESAPADLKRALERAIERALQFLAVGQHHEGSWTPLWFGNQHADDETNRVYGTARVIQALTRLDSRAPNPPRTRAMTEKGARWLAQSQNRDGGWGGGPGLVSSVEETALALEALVDAHRRGIEIPPADLPGAVAWLVERVESNAWREPAPLGFYFARLWYFERLYPLIFTVSALRTVRENLPSTGR